MTRKRAYRHNADLLGRSEEREIVTLCLSGLFTDDSKVGKEIADILGNE